MAGGSESTSEGAYGTAKDRERKVQSYYGQIVVVLTLMGSIAFAGLVLVLGSPTIFQVSVRVGPIGLTPGQYSGTLTGVLIGIGLIAITGSVASANVSSFGTESNGGLKRMSDFCLAFALLGFSLLLLLISATTVYGIFNYGVIVVEAALLLPLGWYIRKAHAKATD